MDDSATRRGNIWTVDGNHSLESPPPYNCTDHLPPGNPPPYTDQSTVDLIPNDQTFVETVRNYVQYLRESAKTIICFKYCCGIVIGMLVMLSFIQLMIGHSYRSDCPRQRYIPIYLIVAGCFGLLRGMLSAIAKIKTGDCCQKGEARDNEEEGEDNTLRVRRVIAVLLNSFLAMWLIIGSVWVYGVSGDYQNIDPEADGYCDQTLYLFSFWSITAQYGCIVGALVLYIWSLTVMRVNCTTE